MASQIPNLMGFFSSTMSRDQVEQMLQVMDSQMQSIALFHGINRGAKPPSSAKARAIANASHPSNANKTVKEHAPPEPTAAKRPLNSYIAFRSYYGPIFVSSQQREISGFLKDLWKEDPFKAKWTIIAKAYSTIRDTVGKPQAKLDAFLAIVCPFIGVVGPTQYFTMLGWAVITTMDGGKQLQRTHIPNYSTFPATIMSTKHSIDDVLAHCRYMGYLASQRLQQKDISTLSMAANPVEVEAGTNPAASSDGVEENTTSSLSDAEAMVDSVDDMVRKFLPAAINEIEDSDNINHVTPVNPADQVQSAINQLSNNSAGYPFTDQFLPNAADPIIYNPEAGDDYNSFNISSVFNFDFVEDATVAPCDLELN